LDARVSPIDLEQGENKLKLFKLALKFEENEISLDLRVDFLVENLIEGKKNFSCKV